MRMRPRTSVGTTPFAAVWAVPRHLRGLACQVCGHFFQDGESHGELDLSTGVLTCQWRTVRVFRDRVDAHPGEGL
jgi:hypothetical protein